MALVGEQIDCSTWKCTRFDLGPESILINAVSVKCSQPDYKLESSREVRVDNPQSLLIAGSGTSRCRGLPFILFRVPLHGR
jgi:hypothetical protein